jgi:hypothetical protein
MGSYLCNTTSHIDVSTSHANLFDKVSLLLLQVQQRHCIAQLPEVRLPCAASKVNRQHDQTNPQSRRKSAVANKTHILLIKSLLRPHLFDKVSLLLLQVEQRHCIAQLTKVRLPTCGLKCEPAAQK